MNITVEKLPNCTASVRIELPGETLKAARERILKNYVQQAALPGFRKGKAPRTVVEKKYGAEIERDVTDRIVNDGLEAAVKQENLRVLNVTHFQPAEDNTDSRYAFSLKVTLAPEVALPDYKGLTITVPKYQVTDEMIDRALQEQRERMADFNPVERAVQNGDFLTIDYTATVEGTPAKEVLPVSQAFIAENTGYLVKADEGSFLPGFCAQLEGMSAGETRDVTVTMPAEGVDEALAGKEVVYTVTVTGVKEAILPELNDEFAARLAPGKTLDEVRGLIRENLTAQANQKDLEQKRIAAMVALRERVEFDLPETVVDNATRTRVNQLVRMNLDRGITEDVIVENEQDIVNAATEQAKVDVKDEYILLEVVRSENIQVTQQDMVQRITHIAYSSRSTPDKVVKTLKKNDGLRNLSHQILLGKALDVLVRHATVIYGDEAPVTESATETA
jgi:trigger factor